MSLTPVTSQSGGSAKGRTALTGTQLDLVLRAAHKAMTVSGVDITPCKVNKIVRRFAKSLARSGMTFGVFLENKANQRWMPGDPIMRLTISYIDSTGERACNRVMRERGF